MTGEVGRRAVLAGLAATVLPAFSAPADDAAGAALDAAARVSPAQGLAILAALEPASVSAGRRLDLLVAADGLAVDALLANHPDEYSLHIARTLGRYDVAAATRRLDAAIADLHARALTTFDSIGITGPTIGARFRCLFAETRDRYPDDASGRTRAVADMAATLARFRADTPRLIADVPPFAQDVTVRTLTPAELAAGKQGYREAPAPGRSGAYIVDLRDIARRPAWSLPSVVAHELLPGHMVQLGIEEVAPPHPLRLRYAAAFTEGWATYAETLVAHPDPRTLLGHLHWLIFRAARGRIDIGIHRDGWSLDQARAKLIEWQGEPAYFAGFDIDLARIAKDPGTRTAEALAWLALADQAPRSPAARSRWHTAVLANGRTRLEHLP